MNRLFTWALLVVLLGSMVLGGVALAQSSTNYDLSWHVVGSGGALMSSTDYALQGTIGQTAAGDVESANYGLYSQGYWLRIIQFPIYLPILSKAYP